MIDYCVGNSCQNGATCNTHATGYTCTCTEFYRGPNCTTDINECTENPLQCNNGGTCMNQIGTFVCRCPVDYTGRRCESIFVPCQPSPCLHEGMCIRLSGQYNYECSCLAGKSFLKSVEFYFENNNN